MVLSHEAAAVTLIKSHPRHLHLPCFLLLILMCVFQLTWGFSHEEQLTEGHVLRVLGKSVLHLPPLTQACAHLALGSLQGEWLWASRDCPVPKYDLFSVLHEHRLSPCQKLSVCVASKVQMGMAATLSKISQMFGGLWGRQSPFPVIDRPTGAYGPGPNRIQAAVVDMPFVSAHVSTTRKFPKCTYSQKRSHIFFRMHCSPSLVARMWTCDYQLSPIRRSPGLLPCTGWRCEARVRAGSGDSLSSSMAAAGISAAQCRGHNGQWSSGKSALRCGWTLLLAVWLQIWVL